MPEVRIISVGTKLPNWVSESISLYLKRIPKHHFNVNLVEISASKRTTTRNIQNILELESTQVIERIPAGFLHISLDRSGKHITSQMLSISMNQWLDDAQNVAISIGGPEGFPSSHFNHCQHTWSLSKLTLAHPIARIVLAEQLFRGWSIMTGHPYHRGEKY